MTEARGIGPMPPTGIAESSVAHPAVPGVLGVRVAGAALAAILAALAVAIAVRLDALLVANPADSPIAVVFGPDGLTNGEPAGSVLVWAVGPVAAAVAGLLFAPSAVRRVDGAGLWMGTATYVIAILIAPAVLIPGAVAGGIRLTDLEAVPFLWLISGVMLGPLLGVCLVAGPIWGTVLRLTTGGPADGQMSRRSLPIWPIVALSLVTFAGWAVAMTFFAIAGNAAFD